MSHRNFKMKTGDQTNASRVRIYYYLWTDAHQVKSTFYLTITRNLKNNGIETCISRYKTERQDLSTDYSLNHDMDNLLHNTETSGKIEHIQRLKKKILTKKQMKWNWFLGRLFSWLTYQIRLMYITFIT